jgi:hypothetical protein
VVLYLQIKVSSKVYLIRTSRQPARIIAKQTSIAMEKADGKTFVRIQFSSYSVARIQKI